MLNQKIVLVCAVIFFAQSVQCHISTDAISITQRRALRTDTTKKSIPPR